MKDVLIGFACIMFAVVIIFAMHQQNEADKAARANMSTARLVGCRAPVAEGDITMITIDVRDGKLFGDCHYATMRTSKPRKGA